MLKYAGVVVNNTSISVDKIFTYKIPSELTNEISVGYRVFVPFGMKNKIIEGYVFEIYENIENNHSKIKEIKGLCDNFPMLRNEDVEIVKLLKKHFLCTFLEGIKAILPTGLSKGVKQKYIDAVCIGKPLDYNYSTENYEHIISIVKRYNQIFTRSALSKKFNLSLSSINTLIKHGYLYIEKKVESRYDDREFSLYKPHKLNFEQEQAVYKILNAHNNISLIHGVTGSGKTEIYLNLIDEMLKREKDSIILVPEISLTPQMVERFKGRFGKNIAVFHSKLSLGERYDEWMRVKNGEVKLAIGARSAIFLPFNNLGLIVIDEEHELTYKADSDPKYSAKDVAQFRSEIEGCKVVMGSATPSIEMYYKAVNGKINLINVKKRVNSIEMPQVEIVDMRDELINNNKSIFSRMLYNNINECLDKKEQIILFLNRRGFSTFVSCRKCGYVFKCKNCDIAMTYHSSGNYLSCHYCGSTEKVRRICPQCGSNYVKYFGSGTEKLEREVSTYFPNAKILRMDFDTTRKKNSYNKIYDAFKKRQADILIGTQMVTKGLDFDNVTLVGVIAADLSLNLPDYRSQERTFQLITQVAGRAGRSEKKGKVIVQTYTPDNFSILCSSRHDYISFFNEEISLRKSLQYPPFTKILSITLSSVQEKLLIDNIQKVGIILKEELKDTTLLVLGPSPCAISKIKENYRWQILIKGDIQLHIAEKIKLIVYKLLEKSYNSIRISMDINPNSLI